MTEAKVQPGACGFPVLITVESISKKEIKVRLGSGCEMLQKMNEGLTNLDWRKGIFGKVCDSLIYRLANACISHVACPVPSAIIKAIEVEIGAAVPKDVTMSFSKE